MKRLDYLALGLPLAAALCVHQACSTDDSTGLGPGEGGGTASGEGGEGAASSSGMGGEGAASSSGTGAGTSSGTGGSSSSSGGPDASFDADFTYDAPYYDAGLEDACVDETAEAQPVPLDIYFLLDASTSMSSPAGFGAAGDCNAVPPFNTPSVNSKWCKAVNAMAGYVSDPLAAGNQAAVQYFKHYSNHNCNGNGYNVPAVPLGLLPGNYSGHAQTFVTQNNAGLNWAYPWSNTPTEGALRGLASFTAANTTPGRVIIGVLVTDGVPSACSTSNSTLSGITQTHFNNTGIHTFIVGMDGANFNSLEAWASYTGALSHPDGPNNSCGNGPGPCHHYNVGNGNPAVFVDALLAIQNAVLGCTFQIPQPSQGVLDPNLVIVEYYPNGQPPAVVLPRVMHQSQCNGDGWYYDNNTNPTVINLCPASCNTVQADPNAQIKIRIACQGS